MFCDPYIFTTKNNLMLLGHCGISYLYLYGRNILYVYLFKPMFVANIYRYTGPLNVQYERAKNNLP